LRSQNPSESHEIQRGFLALFESLPFNDEAAEIYAVIRADLVAKGMPIGANDYLIAAIALANDLILVTHNTREFSRIADLKLEDWEIENT
jgi:tRNA(fMet)-specific endonuclease VapC